MKIKKGDLVAVIAGKDKGKTGKVLTSFPKDLKVLVEGVNILKKHKRAVRRGEKGQIVESAQPIHISNVMMVDPKTKKPTRIGKQLVDGVYKRVAKKSGTTLDK